MSNPVSKRAPKPLIVIAIALAVLAGVAAWAAIPLMSQPVVKGAQPASFIGVESAQTGGSLWAKVVTAKPVNLAKAGDVELTIAIASDRANADPVLIFGGQAATALTACDGTGAFVDPAAPVMAFTKLPSSARSLVLDYERHAPRTGELDDWVGYDTASTHDATARAKSVDYRTADVSLTVPGKRVWTYADEAEKTYPVSTASITCAFRYKAFLRSNFYVQSFSAPDVFAGVADLHSQGPVRIDYRFDLTNNTGEVSTASTFPNENQHVDNQTGNRLVTFSGNWWQRLNDGRQGILISSGLARFEPNQAANWRILARLLVGFLASFCIALLFLAARKSLYYWL